MKRLFLIFVTLLGTLPVFSGSRDNLFNKCSIYSNTIYLICFCTSLNSLNKFIGSRILADLSAGVEASIRFHPHWEMVLTGYFVHHSNGMTHIPNLGTNQLSAGAKLKYYLAAHRSTLSSSFLQSRTGFPRYRYDGTLFDRSYCIEYGAGITF